MSAKAKQQRSGSDPFQYEPTDLIAPDEAALATFLKRNASGLKASAEKALDEFERSECGTLDQALADIEAQRQRRRESKP